MKAISRKSYLLIPSFTALLSFLIIVLLHLLIYPYPLITRPLMAQERPFRVQTRIPLEQRNASPSPTTELDPAKNPGGTTSKPQARLETVRGGRHEKYCSIVFQFSDEVSFGGPRIRGNEILLKLRDVATELRPFRKYKTFDSWVKLKKAGHNLDVQIGLPRNFAKPHVFLMENPHQLVINLYPKKHGGVPSVFESKILVSPLEISQSLGSLHLPPPSNSVYAIPASQVESPRSPSKATGISKRKEFFGGGNKQQGPVDLNKARQLSWDGDYEAAKAIYKQLLNKNPRDVEAAIGLATVTAWSGDHDKARQLYEEVLKQQPANRDALLGLGRVLSWDGDYEAAKAIYKQLLNKNPRDVEAAIGLATVTAWSGDHDKARQLYEEVLKQQPANRDALLGLGRVLFWQQEYKQSLKIFDQLLVIYPGDQEALEVRNNVLQAKEAKKQFKIRVAYQYQDLSFTSNAYGSNFLISFNEPRKWGVRAGFDYVNKFGDSAPGYRVGGNYWVTENTALSLDVELAPGHVVVPRQAYTLEVSQVIFKTFVPSLSYRFTHYATADAHIVMPGFTWYFYPRFDWMVRYFYSVSQFGGQNHVNHSGMTRLNWNVFDPVTLFLGYARANESFDSGNPADPYGAFSADHVFAGFSWEIYKGVGFDFTFDYEKRNNGFILKTFNTAIIYRW
ncbi:MAG: tetratricopeptide repeat protein [Deltaproteobacteria bacterium]|nr:tetratricopeptide repeat protein [Deltaproteobacteria bacterium]